MVVDLVVALCTGQESRPVDVQVAFLLHVVAYFGVLVRPVTYYMISSTLRQTLVNVLRCRRVSN